MVNEAKVEGGIGVMVVVVVEEGALGAASRGSIGSNTIRFLLIIWFISISANREHHCHSKAISTTSTSSPTITKHLEWYLRRHHLHHKGREIPPSNRYRAMQSNLDKTI